MSKTRYRFVHLSDIHFGQEKKGTLVIHQDVRDKLVEDCEAFSAKQGHADGILVIGDIAYAGKREEYDSAAQWLTRISEAVGCEPYSVRTIPGNHDIDRSKVNAFCKNAHSTIRGESNATLNSTLEELLAVEEQGNPLLPKVAAYREFASRFDCDFPSLKSPCWSKDYPLGSQYTLRLLGMSSVQVSDEADALGKMILGNNQYVIKEETNVVPVALIHHPLPWFKDATEAKPLLHRAAVLMFGHEHSLGVELVKNHYEQVQLQVFAGATNPPVGSNEFPFRYNWIEFELSEDPLNRHIRVSVWPRVWSVGRAAFISDQESLGARDCIVEKIPCPKFAPEVNRPDQAEDTGDSASDAAKGRVTMEDHDHNFERLKYFFWTHLDWQERLKALAHLDVLPKTANQPMPQTLEHLALQAAKRKGRMKELWDMTMAFVPPEEQLPNPYNQSHESEVKHV